MSDGALSQAEIDALLSGGGGGGGGKTGGGGAAAAGSTNDIAAVRDCLAGTVDAHSANLQAVTGVPVTFSPPNVAPATRDSFLAELPDTVTTVKVDFNSGFPGEHLFVMGEDTAKRIASLMNKEENITLDEMARSVIGEAISQLVGTETTSLTNKNGNKNIAYIPPEAANIAKGTVALPAGDFTQASYKLDLGDGADHKIWEIMSAAVSSAIAQAIRAASAPPPSSGPAGGGGGMGGIGSGVYSQTPGVQPVQFPGLSGNMTSREQGNIGLLMDVFMEMTVELGRTRKLIKEILSMGEGTIIELDKLAGEPVDILVNHVPIAKGEVVVIDENFGVRVTEIVSPAERMGEIS
ncbi:MAG: flagellar motor switch protein FliN [Spirochaetaceae bacterium]|jgi:flagellar motor switch protein FliN/FliY|nr:flagellar motor switch protein FliN [Spirochaetaceae bacterium]